jgi:plasmid maintenance system killer protein
VTYNIMVIVFEDRKFEKQCNSHSKLVQAHGALRAKKIRLRLDDLMAALTLEDIRNAPGRCHELHGNLADHLSLDLDHPYRLLFVPNHEPIPRKEDGGLDWTQVIAVKIVGIRDTHE